MLSGWRRGDYSTVLPEMYYRRLALTETDRWKISYQLYSEFLEFKNPCHDIYGIQRDYLNNHPLASVLEIGVKQDIKLELISGDIYLYLRASPFSFDELVQHCKAIPFRYDEFYYESRIQNICIVIRENRTATMLKKLQILFDKINQKNIQAPEIPEALKTELFNLIQQPSLFKILPEEESKKTETAIKPHVNPEREASTDIVDLIDEHKGGVFPMRQLEKELIRGSDPDQSRNQATPLIRVICRKKNFKEEEFKRVVILLLGYGANPYERFGFGLHTCANDAARYLNETSVLTLFVSAAAFPRKPISLVKSNNVIVFRVKKAIYTLFKAPINKVVITKKLEDLTEFEKANLYHHYFKVFKPTKSEFERNFKGKNRSVDLVFEENKFKGFNLYQKENDNGLNSVVFRLSSLEPENRGSCLMDFLKTRQAVSTYLLNHDGITGCFYDAMSAEGFRFGNGEPFIPKNNPAIDTPQAEIALDKMTERFCGLPLEQDETLYPHVQEEVVLKHHNRQAKNPNIQRTFFQEILQNGDETRGVVVFFYMTMQSFLEASGSFEAEMGINYFRHCFDYARLEGEPEQKKPLPIPALPDRKLLFWYKQKVCKLQDEQGQNNYLIPSHH